MLTLVLYLQEFQEEIGERAHNINYYDDLPKYIHEMSSEELIKHINRSGENSRLPQQSIILTYLKWLNSKYDIDCTDLFFNLKQGLKKDENKSFVGFYSLSEMQQVITNAEFTLENVSNSDWDGLYAVFYLEWYGVIANSIISIKLNDVTDDGKIVYIPAENRVVTIDDLSVSEFFATYKQKTGFKKYFNSEKIAEYTQDTFIRIASQKPINHKTIYNLRGKFVKGCGDKRFSTSKVYDAGRLYVMYQEEIKLNDELSSKYQDMIESIYHQKLSYTQISNILRLYNVYKQKLLGR